MQTKAIIIKILKHALFLIILYILQSMVFPRLKIHGVCPVILPIAVVGVALFEGSAWGAGFGAAAGMFCDLSFYSSPVVFTIFLAFTGLMVGLMADHFLANGFPSYLLASIAALLLTAFLQMFQYLAFQRLPFANLAETALAQTLYSMLFILPLYFPAKKLRRRPKA